jgi:hypothetical protein
MSGRDLLSQEARATAPASPTRDRLTSEVTRDDVARAQSPLAAATRQFRPTKASSPAHGRAESNFASGTRVCAIYGEIRRRLTWHASCDLMAHSERPLGALAVIAEVAMLSSLTEYTPELEIFAGDRVASPDARGEIFSETSEMDLAAELLAVKDEQELEQFLGELVRTVARRIGAPIPPPVAQAIGGILKGILKNVVPRPASAAATLPGGPLGAAIGSGLASLAGETLGLELEGLSREDQEFATAKRFVRFAGEAVNDAVSMPSNDPAAAARAAVIAAARRLAPGLTRFLRPRRAGQTDSAPWLRQASRNHRQAPITRATPTTHIRPAEATMHDIDQTQLEYESEGENFEYEQYEQSEWEGESGPVFSEAEEMELAAELMEVRDEQELDRFLSDVIKGAGRALGRVVRSPLGQAVGGMLKGVAAKALPLAGTAVGTWLGGPLGAQIGSGLSTMAGNALGLEAETWSQEDREFEGAKQFVRLAADSVKNAAEVGPGVDPRAAAQAGLARAAQTLAPGLLQSSAPLAQPWRPHGGNSGRWRRRGSRIVLYGV